MKGSGKGGEMEMQCNVTEKGIDVNVRRRKLEDGEHI